MKRIETAVCEGFKGGFIAFAIAFVIGALLAVGHAFSGHTVPGVQPSAVEVGSILGGSLGALFFVIMFVGGLVERAKPATK